MPQEDKIEEETAEATDADDEQSLKLEGNTIGEDLNKSNDVSE